MAKIGAKKTATKTEGPATGLPAGIRMSNNHYLEVFRALISGPSGVGKTFCAATMSEHFPKDLDSTYDEELTLSDMLWCSVDAGALTGLGQFNITVPEISLLEDIMRPPKKGETKFYQADLIRALAKMLGLVKDAVCNHGIRTVVLDTASQLNREICTYWADPCRRPSDDFKYWRVVRDTEASFFPKLLTLPCNLIILSHEKAVLDGVSAAEKRLKAVAPAGDHQFTLAISGGALGDYYANLDVAVTLLSRRKPGSKAVIRKLHPFGADGRVGKCRLQHLLNDTEEPHLQNLYQQLKRREKSE